MKEYWVNVYENGIGSRYESVEKAVKLNPSAYFKKIVKYRIHVKMKDKVGLSREYSFKFVSEGVSEIINRPVLNTGKYSDFQYNDYMR